MIKDSLIWYRLRINDTFFKDPITQLYGLFETGYPWLDDLKVTANNLKARWPGSSLEEIHLQMGVEPIANTDGLVNLKVKADLFINDKTCPAWLPFERVNLVDQHKLHLAFSKIERIEPSLSMAKRINLNKETTP